MHKYKVTVVIALTILSLTGCKGAEKNFRGMEREQALALTKKVMKLAKSGKFKEIQKLQNADMQGGVRSIEAKKLKKEYEERLKETCGDKAKPVFRYNDEDQYGISYDKNFWMTYVVVGCTSKVKEGLSIFLRLKDNGIQTAEVGGLPVGFGKDKKRKLLK